MENIYPVFFILTSLFWENFDSSNFRFFKFSDHFPGSLKNRDATVIVNGCYKFNKNLLNQTIVIRNRLSGNTGRLNRNLYVMLKFTKRPKTPGMTSKKTLLSLKGISRFCANLDETKVDMVQFKKRWN